MSTNATASRPKTRSENKKIDLGAAAIYARQMQQEKQQHDHATHASSDLIAISDSQNKSVSNNQVLTDLFSDLNVDSKDIFEEIIVTSNSNVDDFADFTQFGAKDSNDDFADFQSAFDSSAQASNSTKVAPILLNSDSSLFASSSNGNNDSFAAMNPFLSLPQAIPVEPQIVTQTPLMPQSALCETNSCQESANSTAHKIGNALLF